MIYNEHKKTKPDRQDSGADETIPTTVRDSSTTRKGSIADGDTDQHDAGGNEGDAGVRGIPGDHEDCTGECRTIYPGDVYVNCTCGRLR